MILLTDQLTRHRRQLAGWSVGAAALTALTVGSYPSIRDQPGFEDMVAGLPDTAKAVFGLDAALSILSPAGYLQGRVFGLLLPVLLTTLAVALGARVLAGQEEDGTLELVVTSATSRRRIVAEHAATVPSILAAITAVSLVLLAGFGPMVGLDVGVGRLAAMHAAAFLLALVHGAVAFGVVASTGRVVHGMLGGGLLAAVGYVLSGLGDTVSGLSIVHTVLPWDWYAANTSVATGVKVAAIIPAIVASAAAYLVAVRAFTSRDLLTP